MGDFEKERDGHWEWLDEQLKAARNDLKQLQESSSEICDEVLIPVEKDAEVAVCPFEEMLNDNEKTPDFSRENDFNKFRRRLAADDLTIGSTETGVISAIVLLGTFCIFKFL